MRVVLVFLVWVLSVAAATAQPAGLKRLTLRQDTLGWEGVGRVEIGGQGFCTGTLIAPDLVLTAGHCLFDRATGLARDPALFRFRAGLRDGKAVAERGVIRAVAHPTYDPRATLGLESIRHDAAIMQLDAAIPAANAAPFPVQDLGRGAREISVVSFAQGREEALSWQRTCGVLGRRSGLLAFDCDVYFGSSGAPVFDRSGSRARIVSIISAGNRDQRGTVSFGMELPGVVADLKRVLRNAGPVYRLPGATLSERPEPASGGARFLRP